MLAASAGVWLFYVQHQFEHTYWEQDKAWSHAESSLHGSSYYVLPGVLRWLTANIGMHHVHHLNSRIPFYRLPRSCSTTPELAEAGKLTLAGELSMRAPGACGTSAASASSPSRNEGRAVFVFCMDARTGSMPRSPTASRLMRIAADT